MLRRYLARDVIFLSFMDDVNYNNQHHHLSFHLNQSRLLDAYTAPLPISNNISTSY